MRRFRLTVRDRNGRAFLARCRASAVGAKAQKLAIANRVARGKFSFVFFLQCMRTLGIEDIRGGERRLLDGSSTPTHASWR